MERIHSPLLTVFIFKKSHFTLQILKDISNIQSIIIQYNKNLLRAAKWILTQIKNPRNHILIMVDSEKFFRIKNYKYCQYSF